ncbi:hypothetical protein PV326_001594 [Microctonus aethiopoides]|nr:hypothetical protein PV326_001594 [Microctonus aethiopoides]
MFTCGTIGWIIDPIITVVRSGNRNRLVYAISYLPSWKLSPIYEILFFSQAILTFVDVISTLSIDGCIIYMINHCCGQIEILREKIKHFRGIIYHNVDSKNKKIEKLLQCQCTCLKCIIDKHNSIIDFARIMENCLSEIMILQFLPGTVSMCSNGYELFKSYYNDEIFAMFWHIIYIFTVAPIFFIFCWLGEELLEKSDSIGDEIFDLDWHNFNPKTRYLFMMIINRVRRPMRLTGGHGLFTMSFERYKNWFMNSISYLSVIAATVSRN